MWPRPPGHRWWWWRWRWMSSPRIVSVWVWVTPVTNVRAACVLVFNCKLIPPLNGALCPTLLGILGPGLLLHQSHLAAVVVGTMPSKLWYSDTLLPPVGSPLAALNLNIHVHFLVSNMSLCDNWPHSLCFLSVYFLLFVVYSFPQNCNWNDEITSILINFLDSVRTHLLASTRYRSTDTTTVRCSQFLHNWSWVRPGPNYPLTLASKGIWWI